MRRKNLHNCAFHFSFLLIFICARRFSEEYAIFKTDQLTAAILRITRHCGSQSYSRIELLRLFQFPCTLIMMIFSWLLLVLYCRSVTPWADHWFHYKARAVLGTHHHSTSVFFGSIGMLWRPQLVLFWCSVFVIWIAEGWSHQMYYWHLFGCCGSLYFQFCLSY